MNYPFEDCIVGEKKFPALQMQALLQNKGAPAFVLFDLARLGEKIDGAGEKTNILRILSHKEQAYRDSFTSGKRKLEWLGGRSAAKYLIASALKNDDSGNTDLQWSDLEILPDENGRPVLFIKKEGAYYPRLLDISISHSRNMAAAMIVRQGRCGIDIQKITSRADKVRDRFCSPDENKILQSGFQLAGDETLSLSLLWAAKESLRKASGLPSLPGFLELELIKISMHPSGQIAWKFLFQWQETKHAVALALVENYALALTIMDDTVG